MISDKKMESALEVLIDRDGEAKKGQDATEYREDMGKVILAKLMHESNEKTVTAKEAYARSHEKYQEHLEQRKAVAEMDYRHRDRRAAASAIIDVWRTQQSNQRTMGKIS